MGGRRVWRRRTSRKLNNKKRTDWISAIGSFSQLGVLLVATVTVRLTVIPIYQRDILEEKVAAAERQLEQRATDLAELNRRIADTQQVVTRLGERSVLYRFVAHVAEQGAGIDPRTEMEIFLDTDEQVIDNRYFNTTLFIDECALRFRLGNRLEQAEEATLTAFVDDIKTRYRSPLDVQALGAVRLEYRGEKARLERELSALEGDSEAMDTPHESGGREGSLARAERLLQEGLRALAAVEISGGDLAVPRSLLEDAQTTLANSIHELGQDVSELRTHLADAKRGFDAAKLSGDLVRLRFEYVDRLRAAAKDLKSGYTVATEHLQAYR